MKQKDYILIDDFSLNLLKHARSTGVSKFLEILLSHDRMPQITFPTTYLNNRKNRNPH